MKIRNFVLGMMTCAAFTACTSDEIIDNNGGNKIEGDSYVAIDIVASAGASTRALTDNDFEDGSSEEQAVAKAVFLFFDGAGNNCATAEKTDLQWKSGTSNQISKISVPVLVLNPITGTIPTSVIAILNPTADFTGKSLSYVKGLIGQSETYIGRSDAAKSNFMMTNSVYALNNSTVAEVALSSKNVSTDPATATANPVQIPVERIVAKVSVKGMNTTSPDQKITIDGEEVTVKAVIKGWKATATNPDSYLVKQINPAWNFAWSGAGSWNNPANFRSYWAVSATPTAYNYYSYTDATANDGDDNFEYCLENAGVTGSGNAVTTNTMLWAVAQLQKADGTPVDFVQWRGTKYSVVGVKTLMANMLNKYYYKKTDNTYATITKDHLTFKPGENQYQVLANLVEGTTFHILNQDGTVNTADKTAELKTEIAAFAPVLYWKNGMTYYYTTITHDYDNNNQQAAIPGIVRNHIYKMNIASITGLGTPIPDENQVIIPTKPETDKDSYLAAQVQVLKWRILEQTVNFE